MLELYKNIRKRREELGLSQLELAELTGYTSKTSISKIESGSIDLPQSKIKAFADALRTTPSKLMGWTESDTTVIPEGFEPMPEMATVPLVGQIACGNPITAEENIEDTVSVPATWHADFTLRCVGNSMEPRIQDGDLVAIHSQPLVENGEIAAVRIDCEATLKRVYLYSDRMVLQPENQAYAPIVLVGDEMNTVQIEGKAVGLCRGL